MSLLTPPAALNPTSTYFRSKVEFISQGGSHKLVLVHSCKMEDAVEVLDQFLSFLWRNSAQSFLNALFGFQKMSIKDVSCSPGCSLNCLRNPVFVPAQLGYGEGVATWGLTQPSTGNYLAAPVLEDLPVSGNDFCQECKKLVTVKDTTSIVHSLQSPAPQFLFFHCLRVKKSGSGPTYSQSKSHLPVDESVYNGFAIPLLAAPAAAAAVAAAPAPAQPPAMDGARYVFIGSLQHHGHGTEGGHWTSYVDCSALGFSKSYATLDDLTVCGVEAPPSTAVPSGAVDILIYKRVEASVPGGSGGTSHKRPRS